MYYYYYYYYLYSCTSINLYNDATSIINQINSPYTHTSSLTIHLYLTKHIISRLSNWISFDKLPRHPLTTPGPCLSQGRGFPKSPNSLLGPCVCAPWPGGPGGTMSSLTPSAPINLHVSHHIRRWWEGGGEGDAARREEGIAMVTAVHERVCVCVCVCACIHVCGFHPSDMGCTRTHTQTHLAV